MKVRSAFRVAPAACLVALALFGAARVDAAVVIAGTRVVYNQKDSEVTLKMSNVGAQPALVQVWADSGDARSAPGSAGDVPFTITPPVARIDPGKGQTLRIIYTGEALAQDRESVFWLNVLEIPPKPTGELAASNRLQLAFHSRIKLFYRPGGLPGRADHAPSQLVWQLASDHGQAVLIARNPSAYHVSIIEVTLKSAAGAAQAADGEMVAPGKTQRFVLKGAASAVPDAKVRFRSLNDYGGPVDTEAPLLPGAAPALPQ
ncbi:MAG TPA: fimbria/pilus periplasmic chaperone [Paraburkholderia sp.]|uniref:fimbria/pilus periplasmic chaperone n=1 Tax=Paraburkholderia sp. TaxID=1926495 RepID=UPI002B470B17|nr:fimbria/pilus periplasmic chaperone [Paraburkholderia sp.]HKR47067.1 fimbria/pilus periplasmic chaperone [Paraburkholderia sp.]